MNGSPEVKTALDLLNSVQAIHSGQADPVVLERLRQEGILCAAAHAVSASEKLTVWLLGEGEMGEVEAAAEHLKKTLPNNVSFYRVLGNPFAKFIVFGHMAGYIPKTTMDDIFVPMARQITFQTVERTTFYKTRRIQNPIESSASPTTLEIPKALTEFLQKTEKKPDHRYWVTSTANLPVRTYIVFSEPTQPMSFDSWLKLYEQHCAERRKDPRELTHSLRDVYHITGRVVAKGIVDGSTERIRASRFIFVVEFRELTSEGKGDHIYYRSGLAQFKDWVGHLVGFRQNRCRVKGAFEVTPVRMSHEEYSLVEDVEGRMERYPGPLAPFAYIGMDRQCSHHPDHGAKREFDLCLPLQDGVLIAGRGTGKSFLIAHVAAAFLNYSSAAAAPPLFDVLYVNCKESEKKEGDYKPKIEHKDEYGPFRLWIKELANVEVVAVRVPDLRRVLGKPEGRAVYTELRRRYPSAINELRGQIPSLPDRNGRGLLIVFDELMNYAKEWDSERGIPIDDQPLGYVKHIRDVERNQFVRYLIVHQMLTDFFPSEVGDVKSPIAAWLKKVAKDGNEIIEVSTALLAMLQSANETTYKQFVADRAKTAESQEEREPGWSYEFEKIALGKPPDQIGPFFMCPTDDKGFQSYPLPGKIPTDKKYPPPTAAPDWTTFGP